MKYVIVCHFEVPFAPGLTLSVYLRAKKNAKFTQDRNEAKVFDDMDDADAMLDLLGLDKLVSGTATHRSNYLFEEDYLYKLHSLTNFRVEPLDPIEPFCLDHIEPW